MYIIFDDKTGYKIYPNTHIVFGIHSVHFHDAKNVFHSILTKTLSTITSVKPQGITLMDGI